jgi:hypothetical protein
MKKLSKDSKSFKVLRINGAELPYGVERRYVKYPRLELKTGKLLVVLPRDMKDETPLLEKKIEWIAQKHAEIQEAIERVKTRMRDAKGLLIFGDLFEVREDGSVKIDFNKKFVLCDFKDKNQASQLLAILKRMLLHEINLSARKYSKKFGVGFNKVFIKNQRTKWASCSSRKNLSFNLKLIHLPKELVRYVVCHEVLHLKEKRHSKTFWSMIEHEFKDYERMERSLFEYWFFVQEYSKAMFPSARSFQY